MIKQLSLLLALLYMLAAIAEHQFGLPLNRWMHAAIFVPIPLVTGVSLLVLLFLHLVKQPRIVFWLLILPFMFNLSMLFSKSFGAGVNNTALEGSSVPVTVMVLLLFALRYASYERAFRTFVLLGTVGVFFYGTLYNLHLIDAGKHFKEALFLGENGGAFVTHILFILLAASSGLDLLIQSKQQSSFDQRNVSPYMRIAFEVIYAVPLLIIIFMLLQAQSMEALPSLSLYLLSVVLTLAAFLSAGLLYLEHQLCSIQFSKQELILEKEKERLLNLARQQRIELKMRQEVARITSHHLRGPSSAILKLSEELLQGESTAEEQAFYHQELLKKAQQNMETIDDLALLFNSLRSADFIVKMVDLEQLVSGEFQRCLKQYNADAELNCTLDFKTLNYSSDHLRVLVRIILANAFQFRHPDRKLQVVLRYSVGIGYSIIEFEDNGIGFNSEKEGDKIYHYGYSINPSGGTRGSGLFLAKGILDLIGDEIEVVSEQDLGTIVRLKLTNT